MNFEQLKAIIWVRWRLTRNQFSRGGSLNAVLSIFLVVFLAAVALGLMIGGFAGGFFGLSKASPKVLLLVWDAILIVFLFIWASGVLVEIQRSESIDLQKLLHLPLSLQQVFIFNYAASHFTPSLVLCVPAMLALCLGLTLRAGAQFLLLVPPLLGFVFMLTAWTYCLRGWLAALMENKRRRRSVIVWITVLFVMLGQLPNLLVNVGPLRSRTSAAAKSKWNGELSPVMLDAHVLVPPGWVGYAGMMLHDHNPWPALAEAAAGFLLGGLGLARAYRMTLNFYRAADVEKPKPIHAPAAGPRGTSLVERRVPFLPDDTAALALATFRSLLRTPELKMALIMPVAAAALIGIMRAKTIAHAPPVLQAFGATAAVALAAFTLTHTMANVFGLDRNGFRALVLLPTPRHQILFAKNLAFLPFVTAIGLCLLTFAGLFLHVPLNTLLVGALQLPIVFAMFALLANWLAILTPYRMAVGTLKASKPKPLMFLAVIGTMLITPILLLPALIPPALQLLCSTEQWLPWLPVNLLGTLIMLGLVCAFYWFTLPAQGRFLQKREQAILKEVTEETE